MASSSSFHYLSGAVEQARSGASEHAVKTHMPVRGRLERCFRARFRARSAVPLAELEAKRLLAAVYSEAVERWKARCRQKQVFGNNALILSGRIRLLPDGCKFDRRALHVIFRNELNGNDVAYQLSPRASSVAVYAAARSFLKVSNSISLRLWLDLPWIGRNEEDSLRASGSDYTARPLKDMRIAVQAINYDALENAEAVD